MPNERRCLPSAEMADVVVDALETVCLGYPDDLSSFDPSHQIDFTRLPCDKPNQKGVTLIGLVFGPAWAVRTCGCNFARAIVTRHGVRRPPVTQRPLLPSVFLSDMRQAYIEAAVKYEAAWLSKWPASKRQQILQSVAVDPVAPNKLKSFVKFEISHKYPTKPRGIQGYLNLHTQAVFGPQQTSFQKALSALWSIEGYELFPGIFVTMASGVTAIDLGRWMDLNEDYESFYERDGKNWDATMGLDHHALKWAVMEACDTELSDFVKLGYRCQGFRRGNDPIRYTLSGTVKSGHNDTTSGNTLVNGFICADALRRAGRSGRIIVAGDDLLAAVKGRPFDLATAEAAYGIVPEARWFASPLDVTFISGCWLWGGRWVFLPQLGRLLARLFWSVKPPSRKKINNHLYGIASGLGVTVLDVPVYRDFIAPYLELKFSGKPVYDKDALHKPRGPNPCDERAILSSMSGKYGIAESALLEFASRLRLTPPLPCVASDPIADVILARDLADILDREVEAL